MKCITCKTNEVNPNICGTDKPTGKSFCSRICQDLWMRTELSMEALQRIALKRLSESITRKN